MNATSAVDEPKRSDGDPMAKRWLTGPATGGDDGGDGGGGGEAWEALIKSFKEAQTALDKNRLLIQQVNENHQSKIPDNLVKNVELIKEINCNISKVSDVYSNLSVNFTSFVNRKRAKKKKDKVDDGDEDGDEDE